MNEMKVKDVMRALECLVGEKDVLCKGCAYKKHDGSRCRREVAKDAITLIRELTDATERLREMNDALSKGFETIKADTVRRMSERVKAKINRFYQEIILDSDIDKISREIMGE